MFDEPTSCLTICILQYYNMFYFMFQPSHLTFCTLACVIDLPFNPRAHSSTSRACPCGIQIYIYIYTDSYGYLTDSGCCGISTICWASPLTASTEVYCCLLASTFYRYIGNFCATLFITFGRPSGSWLKQCVLAYLRFTPSCWLPLPAGGADT